MPEFNKYIHASDYSWLIDFIVQNGTRREYLRNQPFSRANQVSHEIGFIEQGAFRYKSLSSDGAEHIVGYAFKNSFVCDYASLRLQQPSLVEIESMTDSVVIALNDRVLNNFFNNTSDTLKKSRSAIEILYSELYERYVRSYTNTPEERYVELITRNPEVLQTIPLKELASYLNIRPETLSRIRKNIKKSRGLI